MIKTLILSVLLASFWTVMSPASEPYLKGMSGTWSGSGWARQHLGSPKEGVRCKVTVNYGSIGNKLMMNGRCAVPGQKFQLRGSLIERRENGEITGRWSNPFGIGRANIKGRRSKDRIVVRLRADAPNGGIIDQTMVWRLSANRIEMAVTSTQGNQPLSRLTFKRLSGSSN